MARLKFGADGIRYVAGQWPLTPQNAIYIGQALGRFVRSITTSSIVSDSGGEDNCPPTVVLGRDTRDRSDWVADGIEHGLLSQDVEVISVGVMPTPGIAFLTRSYAADLGVSVTASHNPWEYNGVKVFNRWGQRLLVEQERAIEDLIDDYIDGKAASDEPPSLDLSAHSLADVLRDHTARIAGENLVGKYILDHVTYIRDHVLAPPVDSFKGFKVVLDCAHGAVSTVAPRVFTDLGADVIVRNSYAKGKLINHESGSEYVRQHRDELVDVVRQNGAAYGFAFDGDGDRLLVVDAEGRLFDGVDILYLLAVHLQARNLMRKRVLVTTPISNSGLTEALRPLGIKVRQPEGKGDRALEKEMWAKGYRLGGEYTGNIIINDGHHTAADAVYTALYLTGLLVQHPGRSLHDLTANLHKRPQVMAWTRIRQRHDLRSHRPLRARIKQAEQVLGKGAVLFPWFSSTESDLCRVMLEAKRDCAIDKVAVQAEGILTVVRELCGSHDEVIEILRLSS